MARQRKHCKGRRFKSSTRAEDQSTVIRPASVTLIAASRGQRTHNIPMPRCVRLISPVLTSIHEVFQIVPIARATSVFVMESSRPLILSSPILTSLVTRTSMSASASCSLGQLVSLRLRLFSGDLNQYRTGCGFPDSCPLYVQIRKGDSLPCLSQGLRIERASLPACEDHCRRTRGLPRKPLQPARPGPPLRSNITPLRTLYGVGWGGGAHSRTRTRPPQTHLLSSFSYFFSSSRRTLA